MNLLTHEKHFQELFYLRYGIKLKKIDEEGGINGRTADFELIIDNHRIFVCELKEFVDVPLSEEYGFKVTTTPKGTKIARKKHNATNRISNAIEEAYEQLSKYSEPKILALLNFSRFMGVEDLEETYKGYRVLGVENGITLLDVYARRASEGKIKDLKKAIDLYIWIDASRTKDATLQEDKIFFRKVTDKGKKIKREFFNKLNTME